MKFKYNIGDNFKTKFKDITIIDRLIKSNKKYYKYHCNICKNEDITQECYVESLKYTCNVCSNSKLMVGVNDIHTTNPSIEKFLANKNDAYEYSKASNKKITVKCPFCNKKKEMTVNNLCKRKSIKCDCSDGFSMPERIMFSILNYLNIENIKEYRPNWANGRRYDYYIPSLNIIIEMDGGMGHGYGNFGKKDYKKIKQSKDIDNYKTNLAGEHGIKIIRIDCKISNQKNIIKNILNSELTNILDFSNLDINLCMFNAEKNIALEVCKMYNENDGFLKPKKISEIFGLNYTTVLRYLKNGRLYGWCSYITPSEKKKHRI